MATANQPRLIVVRAEVCRTRMRNLERDHRNARLAILRRNDRRDVLVGLELDDQINFLSDEHIRVPLRDLRVVAVVEADQFEPLRGGRALKAGRNLLRELVIGALRGVAEAEGALLERTQVRAIEILTGLFDHSAPFKRV